MKHIYLIPIINLCNIDTELVFLLCKHTNLYYESSIINLEWDFINHSEDSLSDIDEYSTSYEVVVKRLCHCLLSEYGEEIINFKEVYIRL